eukprot:COSAG04_NODE_20790_length_386_cov_1.076655_1_plen_128_part_11
MLPCHHMFCSGCLAEWRACVEECPASQHCAALAPDIVPASVPAVLAILGDEAAEDEAEAAEDEDVPNPEQEAEIDEMESLRREWLKLELEEDKLKLPLRKLGDKVRRLERVRDGQDAKKSQMALVQLA